RRLPGELREPGLDPPGLAAALGRPRRELPAALGEAMRPCLGLGGGEALGRQLLLHRAQPLLVGRTGGMGLVAGAAAAADGRRRRGLLRLEGRQALAQGRDLGRPAPLADRHHAQVELAQLLLDAMVLLGAPRLTLERGHLPLELAQDVLHAEQVLARALHLPLRSYLAAAKARRAGRLLDEQAQLLRLGVDQLIHAPLLDAGIGLRADPGAEEELGDVLQAAGRAVDEVLGLAGPEVAPADQDLVRRGGRGQDAARDGRRGAVTPRGRRPRALLGHQLRIPVRRIHRAQKGHPLLVATQAVGLRHERRPLRPPRLPDEPHARFRRRAPALQAVAAVAGAHDVLPHRRAAPRARHDVVEVQLGARILPAAVLAAVRVARVDVEAAEAHVAARDAIVALQQDDAGDTDRPVDETDPVLL